MNRRVAMIENVEHSPWVSADILPRMQHLLSALADIDFDYDSDVEVVRESAANEDLKTAAIGNLRQLYDRRRAPLVRQLTALEGRLRIR
jgi:hypothetical protein